VEVAASVALVVGGAGVFGAMAGRGIGYVFGAMFSLAIATRMISHPASPGRSSRSLLRYAGPLFVTNSAYTLYSQIDVLIIGAVLGTHAVGVFAAPLRLVVPLSYVGQAIANAVAPRQGAHRAREDMVAFRASLRLLLMYQAFLVVPVIVWARPVVNLLLGSSFHDSVNVLRLMALFIFLRGLGPLVTTTVNYLGKAKRRIPIVLVALALNVAIDLSLLPVIGVAGAAIGTGVAYALYVSAHFLICRRELELPIRPLALTATRSLVAGVVAGGALAMIGTQHLSWLHWVLGGAGVACAYAVLLIATGEVSRAETLRLGRGVGGLARKIGVR
jgi:O-antigen/teichoic acid export membrane protein